MEKMHGPISNAIIEKRINIEDIKFKKAFDKIQKYNILEEADLEYIKNCRNEKMMEYKTGSAFIMNFELLIDKSTNLIFSRNYDMIKHILILFSLFFQIRDDYINLTDINYWKEKGFCQDFDEEKISYLITYFHNENIKNNKPNPNIIEMMKDKSKEGKIKILQIFHNSGLFDTIYNKLLQLKQDLLSEMNLAFVFDQLLIKPFDVNDIDRFLN